MTITRLPKTPRIRIRSLFGLFLLLLLTTHAVAEARKSRGEERVRQALRDRGLDPAETIIPFALDDTMRRWARQEASPKLPVELRLHRLVASLLGSQELELEYTWGHTGTAREVFDSRRANCLAFTNLFLGMAREVGVPVYFLAIETETYRKSGNFVVVSDHIAVGYGSGRDVRMFDFGEVQKQEYPRVRPISDLTAIAMFYSNRGAEVLQQGQAEEAVDWLRTAIQLDPELASAWVNLGVALRRSGEPMAAEEAYRMAIEVDPRAFAAYQNLSAKLRLEKRYGEAQALEETLRRSPNKNPYTYLSLGDISFRSGRLDEARRLYRRAANLDRKHAETYAALGQLALATGDPDRARRMLRKARRVDEDNQRTVQLATLIASNDGGQP